jgi:hypothetical protein
MENTFNNTLPEKFIKDARLIEGMKTSINCGTCYNQVKKYFLLFY